MKKNIIMLLFVGIFCMQITGCAMAADDLIYGTETVLQGSDGYREFTGEDVHSPLIVFPDKEIESISEEFYYEFRDEIFSPVCQIYLKKEYNADEFTKEKERLAAEQLSYADRRTSCILIKIISPVKHMWLWRIGQTGTSTPL